MHVPKWFKRATHSAWVEMQESGAIMTGVPVAMNADDTGDRYAPSPIVTEYTIADYSTTETETVHETRKERS